MGPLLAQGMGGDGGMGMPVVMVAAMVAFAILLVAGVVWLIRSLRRKRVDDPEQVLARRYAEGQIDEEEYQRRRSVLRGSG